MKMRIVWSGLAASAVVLATGTGMSGPTPLATSSNQLVDFDPTTSQLSAYPAGEALTTYLHQPTTVHLPGNIFTFTPPDPCRPIVEAWNVTVEYDDKRGVTSTFVFEALLSLMSDFQCHATITNPTTGNPLPIVYITPTSN